MSEPLTTSLAAEIRRLAQHEIAAKLHINQGRVSEVLRGRRFPEIRIA